MATKRYPHLQPWTPFVGVPIPPSDFYIGDQEPPARMFLNSRYQVAVWYDGGDEHPLGHWAHLSIKDLDKSARHDWRDFQRIKNEICGPEYEAIEVYPAESRLVDTCNQYHLYVFLTWKVPLGFTARLVADETAAGYAPGAHQRPWPAGERPADCLSGRQLDRMVREAKREAGKV